MISKSSKEKLRIEIKTKDNAMNTLDDQKIEGMSSVICQKYTDNAKVKDLALTKMGFKNGS